MTTISPAALPDREGRVASQQKVKPATLLAACSFGPAAGVIREMYEVTEIIDDVCILQLRHT